MSAQDEQKQVAKTFDDFTQSYRDTVNDSIAFSGLDVDFFTRVKADYLKAECAAMFPAGQQLDALDIGCGVGNFHPLLQPHFGSLTGIDVSSESIDYARERNPEVDYHTYEGQALPFADDSFDVAFTVCVMHHVPPGMWPNFTREMYRVLRPGGAAFVFEHNPRNPLTMRIVNKCPFDADAVLLSPRQTTDLLTGSGFEKVRLSYILSVPAANAFLRGVDRLFSPLTLGAQYYACARKP